MSQSKLKDLNDCNEEYRKIYRDLLDIEVLKNPPWFRYILKRSKLLQGCIGYNFWSRAWEYPWAIENAKLGSPCRIIDVGGGGSPIADYLAKFGHDCYVIDPSLRNDTPLSLSKNKSIFKNIRSTISHSLLHLLRINTIEGLHFIDKHSPVKYYCQKAESILFPDHYFHNVLCLSVIEHIPVNKWEICMREFERILKPGGRLIITLDMSINEANNRLYSKLIDCCALKLIGNPNYEVPIKDEDRKRRHGHLYETVGLVWEA